MAINFLNTIKYWTRVFGITISMTLLGIYSHTYIFIYNQCTKLYYSNKTVNNICNSVFTWTHPIIERLYLKKIEPFYEPWCSIFYTYSNGTQYEHYINLNDTEHYLPNNHALFCLNPYEMNNDEQKCDLIQSMIKIIWNMGIITDTCLIIVKMKHQYISRIKYDSKISLEKTRKHLLCVEYIHPKMAQSIYLDIHPGYYLYGNEIFSKLFVERCLQYQKSGYVFDSDYKLKIMDSMMRTVEMNCNEYMVIDKNDYKIHTL
jgi:hypothetical protein